MEDEITIDTPIEEGNSFGKIILDLNKNLEKLNSTGLSRRALVLLLQDCIGANKIKKSQIELVLNAMPRLSTQYLKTIK